LTPPSIRSFRLFRSVQPAHAFCFSTGIRLLTIDKSVVNDGIQANHMQKAEYISTTQFLSVAGGVRYPDIQSHLMSESVQNASPLQNWKVVMAYDGTDYSGWQVQPGEITIQGEIQAALRRVTGESPLPQGSGRTDAGVHALGQVASFMLNAPIPADNLRRALNRTLPDAIRILHAETVPEGFHARHSATAKTYEYRVFRETICPPFLTRYVYSCAWPMNLDAMQAAAKMLEGEHDFASFAATDPDIATRKNPAAHKNVTANDDDERDSDFPAKTTVRTVFSSAWSEEQGAAGAMLVYRVRGNGFLHHMVRNFVGTLLDVGRGRLAVDAIPAILVAKARAAAGPTAPARGLFLRAVEYDEKRIPPGSLLV
jgi:tRNA pseudouridine38-40 synthase